jgi:hypothetical protein
MDHSATILLYSVGFFAMGMMGEGTRRLGLWYADKATSALDPTLREQLAATRGSRWGGSILAMPFCAGAAWVLIFVRWHEPSAGALLYLLPVVGLFAAQRLAEQWRRRHLELPDDIRNRLAVSTGGQIMGWAACQLCWLYAAYLLAGQVMRSWVWSP